MTLTKDPKTGLCTGVWKLPLEARPIAELQTEAERISGNQIDQKTGSLVPNSPEWSWSLWDLT